MERLLQRRLLLNMIKSRNVNEVSWHFQRTIDEVHQKRCITRSLRQSGTWRKKAHHDDASHEVLRQRITTQEESTSG